MEERELTFWKRNGALVREERGGDYAGYDLQVSVYSINVIGVRDGTYGNDLDVEGGEFEAEGLAEEIRRSFAGVVDAYIFLSTQVYGMIGGNQPV